MTEGNAMPSVCTTAGPDRLDAIEKALENTSPFSVTTFGMDDVRWLVAQVRRLRARRYNRDIELAEQLRGAESDLAILRQQHAEAVKLLTDAEWAGTDSVYLTRFCVWCDAVEKNGHADNCPYVALMVKARLT